MNILSATRPTQSPVMTGTLPILFASRTQVETAATPVFEPHAISTSLDESPRSTKCRRATLSGIEVAASEALTAGSSGAKTAYALHAPPILPTASALSERLSAQV